MVKSGAFRKGGIDIVQELYSPSLYILRLIMASHDIALTREQISKLPELVAVDMPCFVSSKNLLFDMCGGKDTLQKSLLEGVPSIKVRLPGADILGPSLRGNKGNCQGMILSVRRKKGDTTLSSMKAIPVGKVCSSYTFYQPAEYQVFVMILAAMCMQSDILQFVPHDANKSAESEQVTNTLFLRPPSNTHIICMP